MVPRRSILTDNPWTASPEEVLPVLQHFHDNGKESSDETRWKKASFATAQAAKSFDFFLS
jgi:hypothetical protein